MDISHLATGESDQSIVGEDDGNVGFGLRLALEHGPSFLHINGPCCCLIIGIRYLKLKDAIGLKRGLPAFQALYVIREHAFFI